MGIIGVVSTESGSRKNNLHFQGVFECRFPLKEAKALGNVLFSMIKVLVLKIIIYNNRKVHKGQLPYLPAGGVGFKVLVKLCTKQQTFSAMVGYCTKDHGRTHYSVVSKGVTAQVCIIIKILFL